MSEYSQPIRLLYQHSDKALKTKQQSPKTFFSPSLAPCHHFPASICIHLCDYHWIYTHSLATGKAVEFLPEVKMLAHPYKITMQLTYGS